MPPDEPSPGGIERVAKVLIAGIQEAHVMAARALSACRVADMKGTWHEKPCTEVQPCNGCTLDAYAVTAAVIASLEGTIADMLAPTFVVKQMIGRKIVGVPS
jgi:hypothetical protein